jgi:invasion protein IalB
MITIGDRKFSLFTQGSDGWAKDSETDKAIVKSMIHGSKMFIDGTSSRGTKTMDTFSLKGFTAAYKAASKACKI